MGPVKLLHASTMLVVLILISGISGWFVPAFYEWTGANQSRPSPLMWQVPLGVSAVAILFCTLLPWIPMEGWGAGTPKRSLQFQVRTLLMFTAAVAVTIATGMRHPIGVANGCCALALAAALGSAKLYSEQRLPIAALLACLFMPFVWIFGYAELNELFSMLEVAAGLPSFFLAVLVINVIGWNQHEGRWIAIAITVIQIAIGLWLIRTGPKRVIAYILFVLLSALVSSLILHAYVRA